MTTSGITNINAKLIHQHPDNPRKDLGDLTELSESIKKKGIMQNLTVIPGHWDENRAHHDEEYTLIIGHRRFAAGKMEGVTMYPCRIVQDMSYKDQVGTMLEENMQRIDLTPLEQAEGFQMMLDLGDTEEQIAEKTGFSRTTVHRRLEIAKLDRDLVKEKTDEDGVYQLNLKDLAQLSRIEDVETRNRILKDATDSRQIQWKVEAEIKNREKEKNKKIIIELLEAAGIKKATKEIERKRYPEDGSISQKKLCGMVTRNTFMHIATVSMRSGLMEKVQWQAMIRINIWKNITMPTVISMKCGESDMHKIKMRSMRENGNYTQAKKRKNLKN